MLGFMAVKRYGHADEVAAMTAYLAGPEAGYITGASLLLVLKAAGLKDSDIDITVAGSTSARFAALKSGTADVTMLAPPVNFFAEKEGFHSLGLMIDYTKDLPFGATDTSLAFAKDHHDTVVRFADALDKSIAWFNTDGSELSDESWGSPWNKSLAVMYNGSTLGLAEIVFFFHGSSN